MQFRLVAFVLHQHKGTQAHQWNEEQCEQSIQTAVAFIAGAIRPGVGADALVVGGVTGDLDQIPTARAGIAGWAVCHDATCRRARNRCVIDPDHQNFGAAQGAISKLPLKEPRPLA